MALSHVVIGTGRDLELSELHLESTYAGLIEGYPRAFLNDRIVGRLASQAGRLMPGAPAHVLEPDREYPEAEPGFRWAFGPPEWLPPVICIGRFSSYPVDPDLDPVLHYSRLVVAWFQADPAVPAVPADQQMCEALRTLRWDELAEDSEI